MKAFLRRLRIWLEYFRAYSADEEPAVAVDIPLSNFSAGLFRVNYTLAEYGPACAGYSKPKTPEEFEASYAERAGMTVEELRKRRTVRPCNCGQRYCEGWQSISHELADEYDKEMSADPEIVLLANELGDAPVILAEFNE